MGRGMYSVEFLNCINIDSTCLGSLEHYSSSSSIFSLRSSVLSSHDPQSPCPPPGVMPSVQRAMPVSKSSCGVGHTRRVSKHQLETHDSSAKVRISISKCHPKSGSLTARPVHTLASILCTYSRPQYARSGTEVPRSHETPTPLRPR